MTPAPESKKWLQENSIVKALRKEARTFAKPHEIDDIILFGSLIKGKKKPRDVDILLLFRERVDKGVEQTFRKKIEAEVPNASIISKTQAQLRDPGFSARDSIFRDGYSLLRDEFLAEEAGQRAVTLILYRTDSLNNSERTRFYYAMNGRGGTGMRENLNAVQITDNLLLVPLHRTFEAEEFLSHWQLPFRTIPALIPATLDNPKLMMLDNIT